MVTDKQKYIYKKELTVYLIAPKLYLNPKFCKFAFFHYKANRKQTYLKALQNL